jgi:hypothetical protein
MYIQNYTYSWWTWQIRNFVQQIPQMEWTTEELNLQLNELSKNYFSVPEIRRFFFILGNSRSHPQPEEGGFYSTRYLHEDHEVHLCERIF